AVAIGRAYPAAQICGVTVSSVQAELGRDLIAQEGVADRIAIVRADYHDLPFPDGCFDVVLFFESCGYSPNRSTLFVEAARVLRPGGHIYVKDVFARAGGLSRDEATTLAAFDDMWRLAASPTLPEVQAALGGAGCSVMTAGEIPNVGNDRFFAA